MGSKYEKDLKFQNKIKLLTKKGLNAYRIAELLNVAYDTVKYWQNRLGIKGQISKLSRSKIQGVYFAQREDNGLIKIGGSNDIYRRLVEVKSEISARTGRKISLSLITYFETKEPLVWEANFHVLFEKYKVKGEMFSDEMLKDIYSLASLKKLRQTVKEPSTIYRESLEQTN